MQSECRQGQDGQSRALPSGCAWITLQEAGVEGVRGGECLFCPAPFREDLGELWAMLPSFQTLFRGSSSWGWGPSGGSRPAWALGPSAERDGGWGQTPAICPVLSHTHPRTHTHTHTHTDLCLLGIILSGNLLAKHLAINTQPRVDGGSQTVKVSTPGSCRPVLRCLGGEANQLSPRGCPCSLFRQLSLSLWWGRGPHPWGSLSPWETLPWLFGTGPSGCPEGTVHTPGRLWSTCSRASAAPSGGGSPRSRDSSPTQPGRHP